MLSFNQFKQKSTIVLSNKIFWLVAAALLSITVSNPAISLIFGLLIGIFLGNPLKSFTSLASKKLLQISVVMLGFGLQFSVIMKVGFASIGITFSGIALTLIVGMLLGRFFKIDKNLTILLTSGTAICGGSAIAAMAPAISATQSQTAVAMAVIFLLNAVGLVLFPIIGHGLEMSQETFGLWAAVAIHDTSSVVGAAAAYGSVALMIGTTVKLTRALWIFPLSFVAARLNKTEAKPKFQWFLIGFLAAGLLRSLIPYADPAWNSFALSGKHLMSGTLFLIGAGLTMDELRKIGVKSLIMAATLWVIISAISLAAVLTGVWSISSEIIW